MRILKQFFACGLIGAIFGVVFLKIDGSFLGFLVSSLMGMIFIWSLYIFAFLLNIFWGIFFKRWIFVFPSNLRLPYGFLVISKDTETRIFLISIAENCGVELNKNIEPD